MDINDKMKLDDQTSDNHSTNANNRYMEGYLDDNNLIMDKQNNFNFDNRIHELLDNQKILNTLRSIKSNHSINYEEIKALPTLFLEMQEALKKSNSNLLELKETINEKITQEKKLKGRVKELEKEVSSLKDNATKARGVENDLRNKLEQIKIDNISLNQNCSLSNDIQRKYEEVLKENKLLRRNQDELERKKEKAEEDVESLAKRNAEMGENIAFLKKTISELQVQNKKYKSAHGALQNEISNIEERFEEVKNYKQEIKEFQTETNNLRNMIKQLEEDRKISQARESSMKDEIKQLTLNNKKIKSDLKNELNEKIGILKEMENLKGNQKIVLDKQDHLKNIIESTANETDQLTNTIQSLKAEKDQLQAQLEAKEEESRNYEEIKVKYQEMFNDFNALVQENTELREISENKKFTDQEVYKITDKYEEEIFNLKCEINIWKNAFVEIAKYKLINCDDTNIDDLLGMDKNYIYNAPQDLREKADNVIAYFKHMIQEQEYHTVNLKSLKEALITEQEKSSYYKEQLMSERHLRRKIHNRYMFIRGNLRVMCRLRPFLDNEKSGATRKAFIETFNITNDTVLINEANRTKKFEFDYIFNMKSQQSEVYDEATLLVQSMLHGNNVCMIAYGQTCTGKTYTIQGPDSSQQGVAIRAAKELFEMIEAFSANTSRNPNDASASSKLSLSIIEIYNENIFNLLAEDTPMLNIYESSGNNLVIPDLNPIIIRDFSEATKLFKLASRFRHTSTTGYNERSSRSHCIFSFHLKLVDKEGKVTRSTLHILDLAGSERISKSEITENEVTKKEAICINLSLHALSNVLNSIAIKASHVPYRDSKLTHFLKESLTENYNILLILHLSPNIRDLGETISTLEFGTRIVKICRHKTGKEKLAMISSNNK